MFDARNLRLAVPLFIVVAACDEGDAHFTTKFASDFTPARNTVSVLGVYKDGRMSSDGWQSLAPRVAPAFGAASCESAYDALVSKDGVLADAIDQYARADGPTDDLLSQVAPAAQGDLVLVLTLAGRLPRPVGDAGAPPAPTAAPTGARGRMGGMRAGGRTHRPPMSESGEDSNVLDISASFYSVARARSVALVAMRYSGTSVDDAMTKFAARLARSLPNMACAGWNWSAKIDPDRIRQSIDP